MFDRYTCMVAGIRNEFSGITVKGRVGVSLHFVLNRLCLLVVMIPVPNVIMYSWWLETENITLVRVY